MLPLQVLYFGVGVNLIAFQTKTKMHLQSYLIHITAFDTIVPNF